MTDRLASSTVAALLQRAEAKYVNMAKDDILSALRHFPGFKPNVFDHIYPDHTCSPAFCLEGTIPGEIDNLPVAIYLRDTHPYKAPTCYVCPMAHMIVRESETVDELGCISLIYLHNWIFPGNHLNGLLQVMMDVLPKSLPSDSET
ncbi:hypothetical protein WUBG_13948 [Wuchereria bancrofti]|uniref:UEV domain-containing protein n=1 Tax=Wuchereria bancrofti TaxID=6293 RepID=J9DZA7_WUCBA|nr:hypothetical protein WUBG_13948 [Wuchereria bancrofti]